MRRALGALLLLLGLAPAAADAAPFTVGTGQNGGIAIDEAGTIFVGWQINVYGPGDAVQFCIVPPRQRRCASQVTIPFPGSGYNRSRVSVLLSGPGTIDVIVPRTNLGDAFTYLARSTDGGHTFGSPVRLAGAEFSSGVGAPGGRVALVDGPTTLRAGVFNANGSSGGAKGSSLGPFLEGVNNDIAVSGLEVLAAGSDAGKSHAFKLPSGGNANDAAAWQQIDPGVGREPEVAAVPGGFAAMLESVVNFGPLFVQRLEGAAWAPPVAIAPAVNNYEFRLLDNARGRLTALITYSG